MSFQEKFNLRLSRVTLGLIVYTLIVILWGAWVRISHSGDGCGDTWPLCQGQLVPEVTEKKTWVEYSHRFSSGFYGLLVIALFFWIRKKNALPDSAAKRWSFWVLVFMISEALLGAKLVLFKLVSNDDSIWRLLIMSLHQINSFLLVSFTVRLFCSTFEDKIRDHWPSVLNKQTNLNTILIADSKAKAKVKAPLALIGIVILAMTGAWAALSTTLFPSVSLTEGLAKDFASGSHFILKLRIFHPLLAVLIGSFLAIKFYKQTLAHSLNRHQNNLENYLYHSSYLAVIFITLGIIVGILTLLTLSPVFLKITHLALAHLLWSFFVSYYHFHSLKQSLEVESK